MEKPITNSKLLKFISLEAILTLITGVFLLGVTYSALSSSTEENERTITKNHQEINQQYKELKKAQQEIVEKFNTLNATQLEGQTRTDISLKYIERDLQAVLEIVKSNPNQPN